MNDIANTKSISGSRQMRSIAAQSLVACGFLAGILWLGNNAAANLARQGIASGFDFLSSTAGFAVLSHFISYDETSTYLRAFLVGLLNTLAVSATGIIFSTILGFAIGIARLERNPLIARLAACYVELMRNLPLLLILFVVYFGILRNLPEPSASLSIGKAIFLNNRGFYLPWPIFGEAGGVSLSMPVFSGFDFEGGHVVIPEFVALIVALSIYTAGFIAEIVRSGINAVAPGQWEASFSLGLSRWQCLRYIVIPQAMRIIIPPLTSQYLNLIKNSSLAAAIGYPDLVQIFAGTVLSQTGQALEIIAMTMAVYLTISIIVSTAMGIYNQHNLQKS